jgi:hypothetical protein
MAEKRFSIGSTVFESDAPAPEPVVAEKPKKKRASKPKASEPAAEAAEVTEVVEGAAPEEAAPDLGA